MALLIPLDPAEATIKYVHPPTAGIVVSRELMRGLRSRLSSDLLSENFDVKRTISGLLEAVRTSMQDVLRAVVQEEVKLRKSDWSGDRDSVRVLPLMEQSLPQGAVVDPDAFQIPDAFVDALSGNIADRTKQFEQFNVLRDNVVLQDRILPFLRQAQALADQKSPDALSQLFRLVQEHAVGEDLVLPHDQAKHLFIVCYLPHDVRYAVQELLMNGSVIDFLKHRQSQSEGGRRELQQQLIELHRLGMVLNSHWNQIMGRYGIDEQIVKELADVRQKKVETLRRIDLLVREHSLQDELKALFDFQESARDQIYALDDTVEKEWQQIDTGHGIQFYENFNLHDILEGKDKFETPRKNGKRAVVLEDDPEQMGQWQKLIATRSPFDVAENGADHRADPGSILAFADDPTVGAFLLDIENGEDRTAGVRVMEQLIRHCHERFKRKEIEPNNSGVRDAYITVWTRSVELLKIAQKRLDELRQELDPGSKWMNVNGCGNAGAPVYVKAMLKCGEPFEKY